MNKNVKIVLEVIRTTVILILAAATVMHSFQIAQLGVDLQDFMQKQVEFDNTVVKKFEDLK